MLKRIFLGNLGLKIAALVLAFFVWILITGKERSYIERTIDIDVEFVNVSQNIDIRYIRPERIKVEVRGTSNEVNSLSPEDFKLRVDLMGVNETTKLKTCYTYPRSSPSSHEPCYLSYRKSHIIKNIDRHS